MEETKALRTELEHYKAERERIRDIVGQIGGKSTRRRDFIINMVFLALVVGAFAFDLTRSLAGWKIPFLPQHILLEIAVLLVSLKIIWMIHMQAKVSHFQFWILSSIEFQINMLTRRMTDLEKRVPTAGGDEGGG
ncbi:MAG: hypothetical protein R6X20_17800 [Phycisphaerae bacterium]